MRVSKFLDSKCSYVEAVKFWQGTERVDGSHTKEYAAFSSFDFDSGYNERYIEAKYITDLFCSYCQERMPVFNQSLQNVKPHLVQSIDYTFNAAGRTKQNVDPSTSQEAGIEENSIIFSVNGSGQISAFRRSKNER